MFGRHGFNAFHEYDLSSTLENFLTGIRREIEADPGVVNADEEEYVKAKVTEKTMLPLEFDTDNITITQREEQIPARYFPNAFAMDLRDGSYPKQVITFHLPFSGEEMLLRSRPSTWLMVSEEIDVQGKTVLFEVINFNNDATQVGSARDSIVNHLTQQAANVNKDLAQFNSRLESAVRDAVRSAKTKNQANADFLTQLGNKPKNG